MVEDHANGSFADLWGVPGLSAHDSNLSYVGVSGNPGAVQAEVEFDLPVAASLNDLYVAFELPAESVLTGRGLGGGAGVGYWTSNEGLPGWLSGDGTIWAQLKDTYSFAVRPVFVLREEGMLLKSLDGSDLAFARVLDPVVETYLRAGPNPFNPETKVSFGLTKEQKVRLDVVDLRGCRIARLVDGVLPSGHHQVPWSGEDSDGRAVASGLYFVRLQGDTETLTQRLVLVR